MAIPLYPQSLPYLDTHQMAEVDRAMMEDYHISLIQMMENAGRNLAHLARMLYFDGKPTGKRIIVLAGTGGNGGGALAAARQLSNWGAQMTVYLTRSDEAYASVPAHQLDILRRMGIAVLPASAITAAQRCDLVLDGLIGYSLAGTPHGTAADLIRWANQQQAPVLSLDVPSGVDAGSGTAYDPAIHATATMTLALPKVGLKSAEAKTRVGELYLADIGVPPTLYKRYLLHLQVETLFAESEIVRLW